MGAPLLLGIDIDGVLARPPFGLSVAMNSDVTLAPAQPMPRAGPVRSPRLRDHLLRASYYRLRYIGRRPLPGARDLLEAAAASGYAPIALTGRDWRGRESTEHWLRRNGLLSLLQEVRMNDSGRSGPRLSSPRFKEAVCAELGIVRHIEDDPATAALLAPSGVAVDLIEWPRSRGLDLPDGVTRRRDLAELAAALRAEATVRLDA
ncbi:MAG: hypothetical protein F4Y94_08190 [Chloroflexi bacterium]|nr:hypothetical protein [Chloroflexota bacterium]